MGDQDAGEQASTRGTINVHFFAKSLMFGHYGIIHITVSSGAISILIPAWHTAVLIRVQLSSACGTEIHVKLIVAMQLHVTIELVLRSPRSLRNI